MKSLLIDHVHPTDYLIMDDGIDGVREAVDFCQSEPLNGEFRVVFIDDAASLSDPAQDALLKVCEEPYSSIKLIMIAHDPGLLQPSFRSRIRLEFKWTRLSDIDMRLHAEKVSAVIYESLLKLAGGLPGMYSTFLEIGGLEDLHNDVRSMLIGKSNPIMGQVPDIIKTLKGKSATRDAIVHVLRAATRGLDPSRSVHMLRFCSTLATSVSANAEIHWMRAVAHWSDVT